jgi:hypothetical protein
MGDYFHINMKIKSKDRYIGASELGCKEGIMEFPTFDGSMEEVNSIGLKHCT